MFELIIIDDAALRRPYFLKAVKIIAKTDRLAQTCEAFHRHDQASFQSWYQLTFKKELGQLESVRAELAQLHRLFEEIAAMRYLFAMDAPEAFLILREEEEAYRHGDAAERARIDNIRRRRSEGMRAKLADDDADQDESLDDDEAERSSTEDQEDGHEEKARKPKRDPLKPQERLFYKGVSSASDADIRSMLRGSDEAVAFFVELFNICSEIQDPALFLRVWHLAPKRIRFAFAEAYEGSTGRPFSEMLAMMSDFAKDEAEAAVAASAPVPEPSQQECLKQIYRKLAKSLHPDVQDSQQSDGYRRWLARAWERLQSCYHRQDLAGLRKLDVSILLRTQQLDRLTMTELDQGLLFLQEEWQSLQQESKDLRKSPAWNFSRKRNYASAEVKIRKDLAADLKMLEKELAELRMERMLLDVLSQKRPKKDKKAKVRLRRRS